MIHTKEASNPKADDAKTHVTPAAVNAPTDGAAADPKAAIGPAAPVVEKALDKKA